MSVEKILACGKIWDWMPKLCAFVELFTFCCLWRNNYKYRVCVGVVGVSVGVNNSNLFSLEEGAKKKRKKKLTSVSFIYVCVAGNGEMLVFSSFFYPTTVK